MHRVVYLTTDAIPSETLADRARCSVTTIQ
jgi:hypothetical protein